jgi:hypothetical protein
MRLLGIREAAEPPAGKHRSRRHRPGGARSLFQFRGLDAELSAGKYGQRYHVAPDEVGYGDRQALALVSEETIR